MKPFILAALAALSLSLPSIAYADCPNPNNDPDVQRGCDTYVPPADDHRGGAGNTDTVSGCDSDGCWNRGPSEPNSKQSCHTDSSGIEICEPD